MAGRTCLLPVVSQKCSVKGLLKWKGNMNEYRCLPQAKLRTSRKDVTVSLGGSWNVHSQQVQPSHSSAAKVLVGEKRLEPTKLIPWPWLNQSAHVNPTSLDS